MDASPPDAAPPRPDPAPQWTVRGGVARPDRLSIWFGRIGARAMVIAALVLAVVALLSGTALFTSQRQAAVIEQIGVRDRLADMAVDALTQDVAEFSTRLASALAGVLRPSEAIPRIEQAGEQVQRSFAQVDALLGAELNPALMGGGRDMLGRLPALTAQITRALAGQDGTPLGPLQEEWLDHLTAYGRIDQAARALVQERSARSVAEAQALAVQAQRIVLAAGAAGLAVSVLVLVVLVRLIARPLTRIAAAMDALSHGRLEAEVPETGRVDQLGDMARAVVVFKDSLLATRRLTNQAAENARRTAIATTQASDAIGQVSDGAMTQLAELRQVNEALSQTADAIRDVVRTTADSHGNAREAQSRLGLNLGKLRSLIALVDAVGDDTERVTRIAGTIAKLATQTNILAINAAIEAARAGEHGRGLAVVAEEVRALAASTEQLAQEIADVVLIAGRRTREGSGTAAAVGEDMDALEGLVSESARLAGVIAVAMEQQQATVTDLNARVETLTRIGQSNATAAEEITVTMIDLSKRASETRSAVESMAGRGA